MSDLFQSQQASNDYTAEHIEVLEGLEPVRRRPGMYIGSTNEHGFHHLAAEILDNAMDEAIEGHGDLIEFELLADGSVKVRDTGRGIPVDPHPKFPDKSALEIIFTTLHSGGKFSGKNYKTSGGLHGVGSSVVNALSDRLTVEVARNRELWRQDYVRGAPTGPVTRVGAAPNRRGTEVRFHPDPQIFGENARFSPARLFRMARSKAYLHSGVRIRWRCAPERLAVGDETPLEAELHFAGGVKEYLEANLGDRELVAPVAFAGRAEFPGSAGRVEWAIAWTSDGDGFANTYCNTIPTPLGGSHEAGLRTAILRGLRGYAELTNNKRASILTGDDALSGACIVLSVFIRDPQFQGQTKERLDSPETARLVEAALKDRFDHWLSGAPAMASALLDHAVERAEERLRRRQEKEQQRKTATNRKVRLPGKLTDCTRSNAAGTEIFLVEGDSAGGSAKQARDRATQAVLPLRGKILNVASASADKLKANQELADLVQALGCGTGKHYDDARLRYERVVVMTDADVDGAHIASLLMTFFFREMPELIERGHLFLALPPLYRLTAGGVTEYARDDADRERLLATRFKGRRNVEVSRFKGLGEMPAAQLKTTTMDPRTRTLLRVAFEPEAGRSGAAGIVERLMGRKPELRLAFIQENARSVEALDV